MKLDETETRRALHIFEQVVDLDAGARASRLAELCGDDAPLRKTIEAMLAADTSSDEPLDRNLARWSAEFEQASQEAVSGATIGAWRIVRVAGRGGMGTVYEVERADGAYQQRAALKLLHHAAEDLSAIRGRFLRERQILAHLRHPHIAALLDGGFTLEGDPYFVMEYVEGLAIDRWCNEHALDVRARVRLFLQVLEAVSHAHRNLLVHRDLKPSNLLVDATGQVKLLDFGIAKQLRDPEVTVLADRAVTFGYASPEQLHDAPITTSTDIWQLGIVLHMLLAVSHPFGISQEMPLARQVQRLQGDAESLIGAAAHASTSEATQRGETDASSLAKRLRGGLAAVVARCLLHDPLARYGSVEELSADLRRWLANQPVLAAQAAPAERARLWLRRNRLLAASVATVSLALIGGTALLLWQAREARRESARARESLQFLADTLAAASPEQARNSEVSVRQLLDSARGQLERRGVTDPRVRQPVQRMLGRLYFSVGQYQQAAQMFEAGTRDVQPESRAAALALADDLVVYSDTLDSLENTVRSLAVSDEAAALRTRFAPDDPEQVLRALAHQTLGHVTKYGWDSCRKRAEAALAMALAMPDPPVDVVLRLYSDLGSIANFTDDRARLLQVSDQGLAFADRHAIPPDSPQRFGLLRNRIEGLMLEGRSSEAEAVSRETIGMLEKTGGVGLTRLGVLYNILGNSLREQGRYREALAALTHSLELLPPDESGPRNRANALSRLAILHSTAGNYEVSKQQMDEAIAKMNSAGLAPADTFRVSLERNHIQVLLDCGNWREAMSSLEQQLPIVRDTQGEGSGQYSALVIQQIEALRQEGDVAGGTRLLVEARARALRNKLPDTDLQFTHLLRFEAAFARMDGNLVTAESSQREVLRRLQSAGNSFEVALANYELAEILAARGQRSEASALLATSLPTLRQSVLPQQIGLRSAEALAEKLRRGASAKSRGGLSR